MPAPRTSVAPVPSSNKERRSIVVFMSKLERQRFKQHAANLDRTMSDIARENFHQFHERNPNMDKDILPLHKAGSPPPISDTRKNLVIFMSPGEHHRFRLLATAMQRPMSDLARDILAPYIREEPLEQL